MHLATVRPSPQYTNDRGFTLVELLVSMAITVVILGATMSAMASSIRATDTAKLLTGLNNGLRTSMDLMVRDMLQVGQGLPSGRVINIPSGAGALAIRLPGPPGTDYELVGATEVTAVIPGPGRGPVVNGQATDMVTTIAADSAFDQIRLTALAADGSSMTVDPLVDLDDGTVDDLNPGDLIMLTKGNLSVLAQVSRVAGQQAFFDPGDSLRLNQPGAENGTVAGLRNNDPVDVLVAPAVFVTTNATRVRMISYYLDAMTDPVRPRLVRRMNNGDAVNFNNNLGIAVAFDMENLQITYDLVDGVNNPSNVRMDDDDLDGEGACNPDPCSPNQIRKVNLMLAGRSRMPLRGTNQFFRNRLVTQVSLRSLALVDRYR
jgi:prepilin-type N-terminal cleavage/methylation domain-containing protein